MLSILPPNFYYCESTQHTEQTVYHAKT